jgi:ribosomal protein S4
MFYIKKRRYKPLYKQFSRLRKNVQNKRILYFKYKIPFPIYINRTDNNMIKSKLKKKKWEEFIKVLKRNLIFSRFRRSSRIYDMSLYHIQRYPNYFTRKFSNKLLVKKSVTLLYGGLLEKYLKKQINIALKKTNYSRKNFGNVNFSFVRNLESRLDTILYRSFFALSIRSARQLITHGHIFVNKKVIKTNSFILKKGDLIEINPRYHKLINKNIQDSFIWPVPPKYLVINFQTFQILFHQNIKSTSFSTHFPFWIDLNTFTKYHR